VRNAQEFDVLPAWVRRESDERRKESSASANCAKGRAFVPGRKQGQKRATILAARCPSCDLAERAFNYVGIGAFEEYKA